MSKPVTTESGIPVQPLYAAEDLGEFDPAEALGNPGEFPFTRGIYPTMYRGRLWTMRQYAGFGNAFECNRWFHYLLQTGQTGLSVALDLPTQMGYDSDHPLSRREVGKVGVAISTLADMESLFEGIPLERISTSFTINATAPILMAMYILAGKKQGVAPEHLTGTMQNDILKEYIARNTYIYPPGPSVRLAADLIEHCSRFVPRFNAISVCGYHIREAGGTAVQEVAFALLNALVYVEEVLRRGVSIDDFAPRISFNFSTYPELFEEVAKHRACRRVWANLMRDRFAPADERSCMMRLYSGGSGASLTFQEPLNNIVRAALQCLTIVLSGAQAVHTMSYDEAYALPSEEAVRVALRTQQIVAYETGVTKTVDPLGGSYYLESLTNELEGRIRSLMAKVEQGGGILRAIENGEIQREISQQAYETERAIQEARKVVVGVNKFTSDQAAAQVAIHKSDPQAVAEQILRVQRVRAGRDGPVCQAALGRLSDEARGTANLMPAIIECVAAYATLGEISDTLRAVFGQHEAAQPF